MKNKIILVGMMGCGKSTVSKVLSNLSGIKRIESDEIFENKFGKITDFFKTQGEEKFRFLETEFLIEHLKESEFIISTGGGIILKEENRKLIFNDEILSVYLKTSPEAIFERIKEDKTRPLLLVDNPKKEIETILDKREKYYKLSKLIIETDSKTPETIAGEIFKQL